MTPLPTPDPLIALEFSILRATTPALRRAILADADDALLPQVRAIFATWDANFPDGARIVALICEEEARRSAERKAESAEREKEVGQC